MYQINTEKTRENQLNKLWEDALQEARDMIPASHQTLRSNTANCLREYSRREQHQWRAWGTLFKFLVMAKEDTDWNPDLQFYGQNELSDSLLYAK